MCLVKHSASEIIIQQGNKKLFFLLWTWGKLFNILKHLHICYLCNSFNVIYNLIFDIIRFLGDEGDNFYIIDSGEVEVIP